MRFSVIIPSYLGPYPSAAQNREAKLFRAVNSVMAQTFTDFECIVISDGCERTVDLLADQVNSHLRLLKINHTKLWSGKPRNTGVEQARGEFITYLDIDDLLGEKHLEVIDSQLNGYDWVWFNDLRFHPRHEQWYENQCDIRIVGRHGTSNLCHKRSLDVSWDFNGYAHDYYFTQQLLKFKNHTKVQTPEYYVCHVPGTKASGGYDV